MAIPGTTPTYKEISIGYVNYINENLILQQIELFATKYNHFINYYTKTPIETKNIIVCITINGDAVKLSNTINLTPLTPFELLIQNSILYEPLINPNHFSQENRIIEFTDFEINNNKQLVNLTGQTFDNTPIPYLLSEPIEVYQANINKFAVQLSKVKFRKVAEITQNTSYFNIKLQVNCYYELRYKGLPLKNKLDLNDAFFLLNGDFNINLQSSETYIP